MTSSRDHADRDRQRLIAACYPGWFARLEQRFIWWLTSPPEW